MTSNSLTNLPNIPAELRAPKRWLQYYLRSDPDKPAKKPSKVPIVKWGTAADREANLKPLDYLLQNRASTKHDGFQRWIDKEESFVYVDLDNVRKTDTGVVEPWAEELIADLDSYTEISASGKGFHIICRGKLAEDFHRDPNPVEIYSGNINKLMALTGDVHELYTAINARQDELEQLLQRVKGQTPGPLPLDWRKAFRSPSELQTGVVRVLINKILPEGTTVIGASAGVGKTWFALSMAKALATGEKFLGTFDIPERCKVLYLIPEQGDRSLRVRMEKLRMPMDGEQIRVRTQRDGILRLDDPLMIAAVKEWQPIIVLDTAIRFSSSLDENSSSQNQNGLYAAICVLMSLGATAVICNHHISKRFAQNDKGKLPTAELENLRGTSDLGAMVDTCWMLQPDDGGGQDGYLEESRNLTRLLVTNVKPRDLADPADPFIIQGRPHIDESGDFRMIITNDFVQVEAVDDIGLKAAELVRANPQLSKSALARKLGCSRDRLAERLLPQGWEWKATSLREGLWIPLQRPTATDSTATGHIF